MANIFFDTNYLMHFGENHNTSLVDYFHNQHLYISTLSCHIFCYINHVKLPNEDVEELFRTFSMVNLTKEIINRALEGPTSDMEDNIQLLSCLEAECKYFLTYDMDLLKMKSFGKVKIVSIIP